MDTLLESANEYLAELSSQPKLNAKPIAKKERAKSRIVNQLDSMPETRNRPQVSRRSEIQVELEELRQRLKQLYSPRFRGLGQFEIW